MKLLKVGSSPSCDIVINNPYVSAHHANITVLDNGDILIEDCGSSNGTFLGVQQSRLKPGVETTIHRGDRVILGNEPLPWNKVPQPVSRPGARLKLNIGSNQRNDIVVPGNTVSRYHATMYIDKDGKSWIVDNKSTNGSQVNGLKIAPERPTQIKVGDNIIIGGEDITSRLEQYLPRRSKAGLIAGISAAAIAVIGLIVYGIIALLPVSDLPDSGVVLVRNVYHYDIELADNPYKLPVHLESKRYAITGTGFFIDEEGRIATVRHVALPWEEEYQEMDAFTSLKIQDELKQEWDTYLKKNIPTRVNDTADMERLKRTEIGNAIINACAYGTNPLQKLNNMLEKLHNTPVKITGKSDLISIAYSNRHYTSSDEFVPAVTIAESGETTKDVAIMQLNTKETPEKIIKEGILDINNISMTKPAVQKDELMFKGYPEGISRTWNEKFNVSNMVPTTYRGKVTRNNDPYSYEIQANTTHGASGSPVYSNGKLYGIVTQVYQAGDDVIIVPARWLKELYDKEIAVYRE